eukprot:TRINITY_DN29705_c0_g1_i1.p1 TRINITY_DN29705_c0_g1~~TRINITY_DN29705_c0_g1_i1.p1  ORF type:complete len:407 (+),score=130.90 TRINITY_DN29705_c0_g1_i1:84-1223(+)
MQSMPNNMGLNMTLDAGNPTKSYHSLQGKYKRFIASEHRAEVENWYNNYANSKQRRGFKYIARSVLAVAETGRGPAEHAPSDRETLQAQALLQQNWGSFIAAGFRKAALAWVAKATVADKMMFRECFGKMRPMCLFTGRSDYKKTYTNEAVENTAERSFQYKIHQHRKRAQELSLAKIRGVSPPPSEVASTLVPRRAVQSEVGSAALACSTVISEAKAARLLPRQVPYEERTTRNTTYASHFNTRPPEILKIAMPDATISRERNCVHGKAPWGSLQEGHVEGAFLSQTKHDFPNPTSANNTFRNYNENYETLLANRYHADAKARRSAGPRRSSQLSLPPHDSNRSAVSAASRVSAARRAPADARGPRPNTACALRTPFE